MLIISNSIPREFAFHPWDRRCDGRADGPRASHRFPEGFSEAKKRGPILHRRAKPVRARRRARQDRNPNPSRLGAGNHVIDQSTLVAERPAVASWIKHRNG